MGAAVRPCPLRTALSSTRPDRQSEKEWIMAKEILVSYGIDVDAVAGWLGSYGGEDSPCDISRGVFAGKVGSIRLLRLFEKWGIKTTWFIPGHSIETFWDEMKQVADAGHEIGMHGYSHRKPHRHDAGAGRSHLRQMRRSHHQAFGKAAPRLCGSMVGIWLQDQRTVEAKGHSLRSLLDAQRPPSLLRDRWRRWTKSITPSIRRTG